MNIRAFVKLLRPVDVIIVIFWLFLSLVTVIFSSDIKLLFWILAITIFGSAVILMLAKRAKNGKSLYLKIIYDWYPALLILVFFEEVHLISRSIHTKDYDSILIAIDRFLFSVDPTVWLYQFSSPVLTEIIQICYTSFYFIMVILGLELYLKKEMDKFSFAMFIILYGFFLSYIGYLLVPAIGPRFTLHEFHLINQELPGVLFTNALRDFINFGESISSTCVNAIENVKRDVFPSGHTQMTLIVILLAKRYKVKSRYCLYIISILLIFGTVYLRYHYVIDLIAGGVFMIFTVLTAPILYRVILSKRV